MRRSVPILLLLTALICVGCWGGAEEDAAVPTPTAAPLDDAPRQYSAEWLINAEAVNAEGPGYPFVYREVVDDRQGLYLVQSPNHVATQTPDQVVFCAAIFRADPFCAAVDRAEGTPHVLSYPVQVLTDWGPAHLYDLASYREFKLVVARDEDAWDRRLDTIRKEIDVECFGVVGETTAAATGFEVCFTDDDLHLVASVDLQGDLAYEIDMRSYSRVVADEDFVTGLEDFIEEKPTMQEQLLALFPEIPAPRPTPTPDPNADVSQ